ncbi:DDE-type integrase/transposase/recombinase [Streptomyces werraensis]|uniref:DDE-type integrase/transposase/recombinase n=1 Tax=Streptomyces werraensis TaxID=68284 RepID=UPI00341336AE
MAFVRINGERKYLWRAVDQDATCWTSSCRTAGTKAAARRFFRRLLKRTGTTTATGSPTRNSSAWPGCCSWPATRPP